MRIHSDRVVSLGMKAAVATGPVRRFVVGDPEYCLVDTMAGATLQRMAAGEHLAERGDVIVDDVTAVSLGDALAIVAWRVEAETGRRFAEVSGLALAVPESPWPELGAEALRGEITLSWVLSPIYERLSAGLTGEQIRSLDRERLAALPAVQASLAEARSQLQRYRVALQTAYGATLRLRTYAVVGLGFERLVWEEVPAAAPVLAE